jgi:gluconolactonase
MGGSVGTNAGGGGTAGSTAGSGGSTGGSAGSAGAAGGGGGSTGSCPPGPFAEPATQGSVTKIMGVPPAGFGTGSSSNVEGPVWVNGSLYVSHIQEGVTAPPPARILKITGDTVEEFLADSGSNGLALAADGRLVVARHTTGSLSLLDLGTKMFTPLAEQFMNARFDSPNDIAVRADGNVYFSDPDYQSPNPKPQTATRVYRVAPGGEVSVVDATLNQPNGVTLSPDENTLYVASPGGVRRYPVNADGSVGTSASFSNSTSDGMVVDCAGNLYLTANRDIVILDPMGDELTRLMNVVPDQSSTTNVAFGGTNRQRLFITARQNAGLWYVDMNVPGYPY